MKTLKEILIDALRSTHLYEMAKSQDKCEKTVLSQLNNILENIILLNYFKISELPSLNIEHWKNELFIAILNAGKFRPKGDNSKDRRSRIVNRVFNEEEVKTYEYIHDSVIGKMYIEKETTFDMKNKITLEWLDESIAAALNLIDSLKELIVDRNSVKTREWVNTTFK
jgi:hypothetical protein